MSNFEFEFEVEFRFGPWTQMFGSVFFGSVQKQFKYLYFKQLSSMSGVSNSKLYMGRIEKENVSTGRR